MKNLIKALLCACTVISVTACSSGKNSTKEYEEKEQEIESVVENKNQPNIVKSGTVGESYSNGEGTLEIVSWELGNPGNPLNKNYETLCIKLKATNDTNEQKTIHDVIDYDIYLDGVQLETYLCDFYGDCSTMDIWIDTSLRAGASAEYYEMIDCSFDKEHTVEIDFKDGFQKYPQTVFYTFKFTV